MRINKLLAANTSWSKPEVPQQRKSSPSVLNDYKLVALKSHIAKVPERLVLVHLRPQVAPLWTGSVFALSLQSTALSSTYWSEPCVTWQSRHHCENNMVFIFSYMPSVKAPEEEGICLHNPKHTDRQFVQLLFAKWEQSGFCSAIYLINGWEGRVKIFSSLEMRTGAHFSKFARGKCQFVSLDCFHFGQFDVSQITTNSEHATFL